MTPLKFVFYLTCLILGETTEVNNLKQSTAVHQERGFILVHVGDKLTLRCNHDGGASKYHWYKQTLGQRPRLISTITYMSDKNGTFYHEFKDSGRFTLDIKDGTNHLKISDVHLSDSATYYCASSYSFLFEFAEGTVVSVRGSGLNIPTLIHQSASETIQPGGSVTLNCIVHTGTCDGEHSVYWFKNPEESHPGLIYTDGDRNDQCERKPNTQTQTCVYNLPMKSLNLSDAGTYYCAVASCGHILFGNGTKLDFQDEVVSLHLLYSLIGALAVTTIMVVLLVFLVCMMYNSNRKCTESQARFAASSAANAEGHQDADNMHYAALSVNTAKRSGRQRNNATNDCVYSSVKL